jgi:abortive infection bacteriophage resistance protein
MIQLESPKETWLLEAPIEVLHRESAEWLEEIEFMKDEAAFFYGLIIRRLKTPYDPLNAEELKSIENHLIFISTNMLAMLQDSVVKHERFLTKMMEEAKQDEQSYRQRHLTLAKKIHDFEQEYKDLKRKIFALVEKEVKRKKLVNK